MTAVLEPDLMVEDRSIWPAVTALTNCLCTQLVTDALPPVCICSPMPGEQIAADYVTEEAGMAWVRVTTAWPSASFPNATAQASCAAPLAFGVELGVLYCAPGAAADGDPPGMSAQFDAVRLQLAAMNSIRRAVICCFPGRRASDVVLGVYNPMGPEGGVVGGYWSISVAEGAL